MFSTTIVAIATPPIPSGVGIIRLSGPMAHAIAEKLTQKNLPPPRTAARRHFYNPNDGAVLDDGLLICFAEPHSFTGEDVVEAQIHGSPQSLFAVQAACVHEGAVLAEAGEFTRRAFVNGKMDLASAEAVADLIHATTKKAARAAAQSLSGAFAQAIAPLSQELIDLRALVEAGLDFADEDINFITPQDLKTRIAALQTPLSMILSQAKNGVLLQEGVRCVILGEPNVGKSSLFNVLAGEEASIVTNIPGTTRDVVSRTVSINGIPFHLSDTAGLRTAPDTVERIGIERAGEGARLADVVVQVWCVDEHGHLPDINRPPIWHEVLPQLAEDLAHQRIPIVQVINKSDCCQENSPPPNQALMLSAKTRDGLDEFKAALLKVVGWQNGHDSSGGESVFIARARHLSALHDCARRIKSALTLTEYSQASHEPLIAEELRLAHRALQTITGEFGVEDLLGEIFGRFCIGK